MSRWLAWILKWVRIHQQTKGGSMNNETGEWLDKEPRADGKPRRWRPYETVALSERNRLITQTEEDCTPQRPSEDILIPVHTSGT